MISVDGIHKQRDGAPVLTDVSFRAKPGRVTALLGPNGSGKSSVLRILLDVDHAGSGTALIDGRRYRTLDHPMRTVGSMLNGAGAHPGRTGRGHLSWLAVSQQIDSVRVDEVLEMVGLAVVSRKRVRTYSVGMRQRLGIAAALLGDPAMLVLDEPANGLDPDGSRWLHRLIRGHADSGGVVLISSHLLGDIAEVADDVVILTNGTVVATGSVAEVAAGHRSLEDAFFALTGQQ